MKSQKKGIVDFKGRAYKTVALRVAEFRAACPVSDGWGIATGIVSCDDETVVMRATITDPEGRVVATGHAEERRSSRGVNSTSALENGETSAIGRALAAAGWGGEQYASADELVAAVAQQRDGGGDFEVRRQERLADAWVRSLAERAGGDGARQRVEEVFTARGRDWRTCPPDKRAAVGDWILAQLDGGDQ